MFIIFLLCLISPGKSDVEPLVRCQTTQGPLLIQVHPAWAPLGAERFLTLVRDDFYRDIAFYRVYLIYYILIGRIVKFILLAGCVKRFLTQFGISDRPEKAHWHYNQIKDDPNLNLGGLCEALIAYADSTLLCTKCRNQKALRLFCWRRTEYKIDANIYSL